VSKLLLNEKPLMVLPGLAKKIGLVEAIILQQMHYWIEINRQTNVGFMDGYYWTYGTYNDWEQQFPFWSRSTIRRGIKNLEVTQLVYSKCYNKHNYDWTKWYRINYRALELLENYEGPVLSDLSKMNSSINPKWAEYLAQNEQNAYTGLGNAINEINKENNQDINIVQLEDKQQNEVRNGRKKNERKATANLKRSLKNHYPEEFETFWKVYPRKEDKAEAFALYQAILADKELNLTAADLIAAAAKYRDQMIRENRQQKHIKLCKTWLNQSLAEYLQEDKQEGFKQTLIEQYKQALANVE